MAYAFAAIALAGAATGAIGTYKKGLAEKEANDYNAKVAWRNAQLEENKSREESKIIEGQAASLYGKAGVDSSYGSPLLHLKWLRKQGELESMSIRTKGQSEYETYKMYGKQAKQAGTFGSISSFLSGGSEAGMKAYGVMVKGGK